jgi:hypothetical protein
VNKLQILKVGQGNKPEAEIGAESLIIDRFVFESLLYVEKYRKELNIGTID